MSEKMGKLLPKIFPKTSFDDYRKIVEDIIDLYIAGEVELDISTSRVIFRAPKEIDEQISRKHKVKKAFLEDAVTLMLTGLRTVLANADNAFLKEIGKDKRKLAVEFFKIMNAVIRKYPEVKNRFLTISFCKTRYMEQLDWEINLKTLQPKTARFEKSNRYAVCLLRFTLGIPTAFRKVTPEQPEEFSFEAGSQDINKMIRTLTEIRERMAEIDQKLAEGAISI